MARRFELVVFDWDGTLMDSTAAISHAIQASAQDMGLPVPSDAAARYVIGLGLQDALAHAVPELPPERYSEMSERYRYHYFVKNQSLSLFHGVTELLQELQARNHLLAIATGKSRHGLNDALAQSGLKTVIHATRCADECFSKPHPQMLEELMDEFGVSAEMTVMIGDTTHDLQMANNAGIGAIAVSYGAHEREALERELPLACCNTVKELRQWLHENG
jgi:phosphoglycolate phosphatase